MAAVANGIQETNSVRLRGIQMDATRTQTNRRNALQNAVVTLQVGQLFQTALVHCEVVSVAFQMGDLYGEKKSRPQSKPHNQYARDCSRI